MYLKGVWPCQSPKLTRSLAFLSQMQYPQKWCFNYVNSVILHTHEAGPTPPPFYMAGDGHKEASHLPQSKAGKAGVQMQA